ncbi:protein mono-ADP-ribosyltransferase PARP11-like isoform X2 [Archocentrus centrarchus]|uniref:protein mono-ADP-ribosyltransferase PARP11-like isoform X2 n=1 Tax=Archocentrus centrarchus TaxID=63155 RepID=UPI0011E9C3C8|nr:protein mono-ADP-ribosyltransferase PARP11-like isoform X2 [Archocentrus centrarchus]
MKALYSDKDRDRLKTDLAMLAIRSSEEESTEIEEMDTSEPNWCWFYLAECGVWHMFEIDPSAACSVTSAQIEQCYNRNQRGVMEFYTAKYTYRLDFSVMRQINVTTGKQRPIKRSLHSATGFRFICDNLALPVPCHWERINTDEPYQLIQLGRDTYEFKEVARLYDRTMDHPIKSIQRIQNLDLWEFFCRKHSYEKSSEHWILRSECCSMAQDTATYKLYVHLTLTGGSQEAMVMSMAKGATLPVMPNTPVNSVTPQGNTTPPYRDMDSHHQYLPVSRPIRPCSWPECLLESTQSVIQCIVDRPLKMPVLPTSMTVVWMIWPIQRSMSFLTAIRFIQSI